jgi:hypothetical protein
VTPPDLDQRGQLLRAAVGFAGLPRPSYDRALWALRVWLDSWAGIGHVVGGMARQGYDLQLTRYDERGWRTERMGDMTSAEVPTGPFTCEIVLQRVRAPRFILEDRQDVTYIVARDYGLDMRRF